MSNKFKAFILSIFFGFSGQALSASTTTNLGLLTSPAGFTNTITAQGNFFDDYLFSIATARSITTSLNLGPVGLSNLSETLYRETFDHTGSLPAITLAPVMSATLGPLSGASNFDLIIGVGVLQPGDYVWEINGSVSSATTYQGLINIATLTPAGGSPSSPVPVPAAVWMVGTALFGVGTMVRRNQLKPLV